MSKEQPQPCPVLGRAGGWLLSGNVLGRGVRRGAEFLNWGRGTEGASGQGEGKRGKNGVSARWVVPGEELQAGSRQSLCRWLPLLPQGKKESKQAKHFSVPQFLPPPVGWCCSPTSQGWCEDEQIQVSEALGPPRCRIPCKASPERAAPALRRDLDLGVRLILMLSESSFAIQLEGKKRKREKKKNFPKSQLMFLLFQALRAFSAAKGIRGLSSDAGAVLPPCSLTRLTSVEGFYGVKLEENPL